MDPSQPDDHAYFSEAWPAVALECQAPWCARILSGEKTVECRRYPLPSKLQGKAIWLVESCGEEGVPVLGDVVNAGDPAGTIDKQRLSMDGRHPTQVRFHIIYGRCTGLR
ncbi:hypothetical protein WJX72_012526 [[Myrmecia] bisecta]|uniref:ASCH domain-containing protein n=1 Tax=[Myrmecia] bisecta TaxID=41462 RepID=A0AAW1P352_9CHLO